MSFGEVSPVCALPLPLGTSFLQELVVTLEPAAAECEAQENPIVEPVVAVAVPVEIVVFVLVVDRDIANVLRELDISVDQAAG